MSIIKSFLEIKAGIEAVNKASDGFVILEDFIGAEDIINKVIAALDGYNKEQAKTIIESSDLEDAIKSAVSEMLGLGEAEGELTGATGGLSGAITTLAESLGISVGALIGITAAIAAVAVGVGVAIYKTNQANEELRKSAKELGNEFSESKKDIADYKSQIESLYETINSETSSTNERREAREKLLSIQDEMLSKYGEEASSIDMITRAINGEVDALDRLTDAEWRKAKRKFNQQNLKGWDSWNRAVHGVDNNVDLMLKEMENREVSIEFSATYDKDTIEKFKDLYGGSIQMFDEATGFYTISGNLDEIQDKLMSIQETSNNLDLSGTFNTRLSAAIQNNDKILDSYEEFYQQLVLNDRIYNSEFEDNYRSMNEKISEYNKTLVSEDEQAKEKALQALKDEYESLVNEVNQKYKPGDAEAESIINFFENLHPEIKLFLNKENLQKQLDEVISSGDYAEGNRTNLQEVNKSIGKFLSKEELFNFNSDNKDENDPLVKAYSAIKFIADNAKMSIQELYEYLEETGQLSNKLMSQKPTNAYIANHSELTKFRGNRNVDTPTGYTFSKAIAELDESQQEKIEKYLPEHWKKWDEVFKQLKKDGVEEQEAIQKAVIETNKVLEEQADKLEEINEELKQSDVSHIDSVNSLQSATSSLTGLYNDEQKINAGKFDANTINSVEQAFMNLTERDDSVDAEKIKGYIEEFEKTLIQFPDDAEKAQEAIDNLVTSYIDQSSILKDLTADNKEWTIQQLEQMGIVNAEEVVMSRLYNTMTLSSDAVKNLADSYSQYSDKLSKANMGSSDFSEGLTKLKEDLLSAFASAGEDIPLPQIDEGFIRGHLDLVKQAAEGDIEALQQVRIEASKDAFMRVHVEVPTDVAKASLQEIWDNVEALDGMNLEVGATLDDGPIIAAFQNIVKTGKASAEDIAAALGAMGYTAEWIPNPYEATIAKGIMAGGGTGNTSADIATSKGIQALETQKVKIDVPSLRITSNGGSSSGGAKTAHYKPTSSGGSKGGGGGGGSKDHTPTEHTPKEDAMDKAADSMTDAANAAKEAFEKEKEEAEKELDIHYIDWIERLLDKLATTVKKWTDAAEDFFTFWNKNMALNRAIMASHEELVAQQNAAKIYENHAKTAAQKAGRSLKVDEEELTFEVVDDDPLSQAYINKIKMGAMQIETLNGKQTALQKKIEEYITWWDKAKQARERITELYRQERDLIKEKLNNILDYYNTMEQYFSSFTSMIDSRMSVKEASGQRKSITDLLDSWGAVSDELINAEKRQFAYRTGIAEEGRESKDIKTDLEFAYKDTEYYQNMLKQREALTQQQEAYEKKTQEITNLQAQIKETTDKQEKKQLQDRLKQLKSEQKQLKLSTADKKNLDRLNKQIETYANSAIDTELYKKLKEERDLLQARQDEYDDLQKQIAEKKIKIAETTSAEEKKALNKELKDLQAQAKKKKLSTKDSKALIGINQQLQAMEEISEQAIVDQATANTANYQELVGKIADLQSKKAAGKKIDENKLAMYLDELAAINAGVLSSSIASYIRVYEEWWKLNQIKDTTTNANQLKRYKELTAQKEAYEQAYRDRQSELQKELDDALTREGINKADLDANLKKSQDDMTRLYNQRIDDVQNNYKNTVNYKNLEAEYQKLLNKQSNQRAKGKELSKADQAKLDKLKSQLDALALGGTADNIVEYLKALKYVQDNQAKYDKGTLKGKAADQYDKYKQMLENWNKQKASDVKDLQNELADALKQLQAEYQKNINENEESINKKKQQMWELAKEMSEFQITSLQYVIDSLDATIGKYQNVVKLLESTSLDTIKKYNLGDLFEIDDGKELGELLSEELHSAILASQSKLSNLSELAHVYQDLIDASFNGGGFNSVLEKYKKTASKENQARIDELIKMLDSNDYSTNEWVTEWTKGLGDAMSEITATVDEIQVFKDTLREKVIFKAALDAIETLNVLQNKLSSMDDLIMSDWLKDNDGNLTEAGLAKVNLLAQQMTNAQNIVMQAQQHIQDVMSAEDTYATNEDYIKALNGAYQDYYNRLGDVESIANEIYQIGKEQEENQIKLLQKEVDLRKKALASRKAIYEYDKNIRNQTKNIEALEAQVAALQDINTAESKAQRKQLETQLQEAREQLEDTKKEHEYDLSINALDDLIAKMEESLEESASSIDKTFEHFAKVLEDTIGSSAGTNPDNMLSKIYNLLMGTDIDVIYDNANTDSITPTSTPTVSSDISSGNLVALTQSQITNNYLEKLVELTTNNQDSINSGFSSLINTSQDMAQQLLEKSNEVIMSLGQLQDVNSLSILNTVQSINTKFDGSVTDIINAIPKEGSAGNDLSLVLPKNFKINSSQMNSLFAQLKKLGVNFVYK